MVTGLPSVALYFRTKVYYAGSRRTCRLKERMLLTSNHCCFYDPIIVASVFWTSQMHFLATTTLYHNRFLRWFMPAMHCIEVDKDNFNMRVFREIGDALKRNCPVLIFPEGTLNSSEGGENKDMLAFKSGAVLIAHSTRTPILPIYIVDRKHWYNRYKIVIGDEIDVNAMCGDRPSMKDIERVNEVLREKEEELRRYYESVACSKKPK